MNCSNPVQSRLAVVVLVVSLQCDHVCWPAVDDVGSPRPVGQHSSIQSPHMELGGQERRIIDYYVALY